MEPYMFAHLSNAALRRIHRRLLRKGHRFLREGYGALALDKFRMAKAFAEELDRCGNAS